MALARTAVTVDGISGARFAVWALLENERAASTEPGSKFGSLLRSSMPRPQLRRRRIRSRRYNNGRAVFHAISIHLSEWDEHDPKRTGVVVYLYVSDADAVRAEWASCGVEGRLSEARNTGYGMREFGFVDSDGTLHRVGSKLP